MDKAQRKVLMLNKTMLVDGIRTERIIWELKQLEVLTPILVNDIERETGRRARISRLIDILTSCGPRSFQLFTEILAKNGYMSLVNNLKKDYDSFRLSEKENVLKKSKLIPIPRTYGEVCLSNRDHFIDNVWAEHIIPELRPPLDLSNLDKQLLRSEKSRRNRSEILFDLLLQKVEEHGHQAFFMLHGILDRTYPHVSELVWNDLMKMTSSVQQINPSTRRSPAPPNIARNGTNVTLSDSEHSEERTTRKHYELKSSLRPNSMQHELLMTGADSLGRRSPAPPNITRNGTNVTLSDSGHSEQRTNRKHYELKSSLNSMQHELLITGADSLGRSKQLDRASQLIAEANSTIKMIEARMKCVEREREEAQHRERVAQMQCKDFKSQLQVLQNDHLKGSKGEDDFKKKMDAQQTQRMEELQKMGDDLKTLENDLYRKRHDMNRKNEDLLQRERNLDSMECSWTEKENKQRDRSAKSTNKLKSIKQLEVEVTRREADLILRETELENREDVCRKTELEQRRRSLELKRKEADAIGLQQEHQVKEDSINEQLEQIKTKLIGINAQTKEIQKREERTEEQQAELEMKELQLNDMENSIKQQEQEAKTINRQETTALNEEKELLEKETEHWYTECRMKEQHIKHTENEWNLKIDSANELENTLKANKSSLNRKKLELKETEDELSLKTNELRRNEKLLYDEQNKLQENQSSLDSREAEVDRREHAITSIEYGRRRLADDMAHFESEQRQREKDYVLCMKEVDNKAEKIEKHEAILSNIEIKQRRRELFLQRKEDDYVKMKPYVKEMEDNVDGENDIDTQTSSDSGLPLNEEQLVSAYSIVQKGDGQNSPRRFQPLNINISAGLTIWGLKTILDKEEGIPANWQRFYYGGIHLEDTATLSESSIPPESSIHLRLDIPAGSTTIILKTGQTTRMIDVDLNETVSVTKARIYKYEGVPPHQQILLHRDDIMDDSNLLHDFNIHTNSAISMRLNYRVWVRTKYNTLIPLEVDELSTIRNVKYLLREAAGVFMDSQKLGFRGKFLDDHRSLIHYKINEGSTLDLTCSVVISQKPAGDNIKMELDPCVTVKQLKEEIKRIKSIPVSRQALVVRDQHLNDDDLVMDHLKKGYVINLHRGNVMVVSPTGKVILNDVQPWHNVTKVKEMLERKTGVSVHMQHLEYQGNALVSSNLRLSDFDIKDGSVLQLKTLPMS